VGNPAGEVHGREFSSIDSRKVNFISHCPRHCPFTCQDPGCHRSHRRLHKYPKRFVLTTSHPETDEAGDSCRDCLTDIGQASSNSSMDLLSIHLLSIISQHLVLFPVREFYHFMERRTAVAPVRTGHQPPAILEAVDELLTN
jgi:hypothetical protein